MTNIPQEMTQPQREGQLPRCLWLSQPWWPSVAPRQWSMSFPIMKCPGCTASLLCHPLVPAYVHTHKDMELEQRQFWEGMSLGSCSRSSMDSRALVFRWLSLPLLAHQGLPVICLCTVYILAFTLMNRVIGGFWTKEWQDLIYILKGSLVVMWLTD